MDLLGLDFRQILINIGLAGVVIIIFAESSLIFFLPGDSLIFVAGLLAAQGHLNLWGLLIFTTLAAIAGNSLGYYFGRKFGARIRQHNSFLFRQEHIQKTENFYAKYGPITVVLARYIPVVRTFAPILAGLGQMDYRTFLIYNVIGALIWVVVLSLAGFWLGQIVPEIDRYILPIVGIVILASVVPAFITARRSARN